MAIDFKIFLQKNVSRGKPTGNGDRLAVEVGQFDCTLQGMFKP